MKLIWLSYLVYSLSNCVTKLCIETGIMVERVFFFISLYLFVF